MSDLAYSDAKYLLDTKPTWSVDQLFDLIADTKGNVIGATSSSQFILFTGGDAAKELAL